MNFIKWLFKIIAGAIASVLAIALLALVIICVTVFSLGIYDDQIVLDDDSVLVVDLGENIVDNPSLQPLSVGDLLAPIEPQVTLLNALTAIELAATDDNIKGIVIKPKGQGAVNLTNLGELRSAIEEFKKSGKFVLAYDDDYSQRDYYLASVADKVYIQPMGNLTWQGISVNTLFFKQLLDGLGLKVEVFRPEECSYKSAVEPFTRTSLSEESRAQSKALVSSLWRTITKDVSAARELSVGELNEYADNLSVMMPAEALAKRMVDGVIYEDEFTQKLEDLDVEVDDGEPRGISLANYVQAMLLARQRAEGSAKVAIIYAEGTIVDGEGSTGEVGGDSLADKLREVREDEDVKSVVLRVNSPGGSALAADVAWREMVLLQREKPVVVSMGGYAASGGYYISCPADIILADRMTVTGSIGVFGLSFSTEAALRNVLGITTDGVGSNTSASFMQSPRPLTPTEREVMMRSVNRVYDEFMSHVADGRNLDSARVATIARGRVYSGTEAQQVGLVDQIGGLKLAIAIARERSGAGSEAVIEEVVTAPTPFEQMINGFAVKVATQTPLAGLAKYSRELAPYSSKGGVITHSPVQIDF